MKYIKSTLLILISAFLISVSLNSCKKDSTDQTPVSATGSLMFHLHTMVDSLEVDSYGDTLVLSGGRQITVTTAQLYLSNIKLVKTDGTIIDGPSTKIFMKQGKEEYDLGSVLVGNYKAVRFDVGLSNAVNATIPSATDSVLYQSSMWYGVNAQPDGFIFVNFEGTVDTTDAATGTDLIPFSYKIGTNANRVTVTMPDQAFSVSPDQLTAIHMHANYAAILNGVQLNNSSNLNITTAAQNSGALATQIKANISDIFGYE